MSCLRSRVAADPFLQMYQPSELKIASEFLSTWLPFLSKDLCQICVQKLSLRITSLDTSSEYGGDVEPVISTVAGKLVVANMADMELNKWNDTRNHDKGDSHSFGSWKAGDADETDMNSIGSWKEGDANETDTNSIGSWKEGNAIEMHTNSIGSWKEDGNKVFEIQPVNTLLSELSYESALSKMPSPRMSWVDMVRDNNLEEVEKQDKLKQNSYRRTTDLSRKESEYVRITNVVRKKDYICLERVKGKIVNILDGLELHMGVFDAVEQKRIVDYVNSLQEMGRNGKFKDRTFIAPKKWMRGKGRETIQFGCCYNYIIDKNGNPPGILQNDFVDPIPLPLKVMIKRLVKWHVLPPSCVPDSCIVNIYEEGDCIPPHIDNHDFVRPFCTVSFVSECNILFGSDLKILGPGEFSGSTAIPLPVGSVLVLNGNGADVAKHCVPAVPTKRISITFRRMDESKRPNGFEPEPDLQGLEPLLFKEDKPIRSSPLKPQRLTNKQSDLREGNAKIKRSTKKVESLSDPHYSGTNRPTNRQTDLREGNETMRGSAKNVENHSELRDSGPKRQAYRDRRRLRVSLAI